MRVGWFVAIAAAFYLLIVSVFWPIEKQALPKTTRQISELGYSQGEVVFSDDHVKVRIPTTEQLQEKGLAGVDHLTDTEGMLWIYNPPERVSFWMKGMLISLDFVWISDGHIIDLTENVQPPASIISTDLPIIDPGVPVDGVLEVADGYIARHNLKVGDSAQVQ